MILYLDASAIITKVTERKYVRSLNEYIQRHSSAELATNSIGFVETIRKSDEYGDFPNLMRELSEQYTKIPVTDRICDSAAYLPRGLKSMDAIHVASAMLLQRELLALVTYDEKMAKVAHQIGLPVAMPGRR
ncbi:type II toxin-antitoxin system VapC family toxin [Nocardia sp. NPDC051321]|uniref:type II toxin-antitoxin system VapC family toxin n=1 Tax=unclassified Nocardia TaxID=2637762 RepID=UPI0037A0DA54